MRPHRFAMTDDQRTYLIETLGCKANLYDSQRLAEALQDLGFRRAQEDERPDVCLVNTCTVTATADRKSRQAAAHLARRYPQARVFVTGCYASAFPDELRAVSGVEGVYGRGEWRALLEAASGRAVAEGTLAGDFGVTSFAGRTRAFLKVQEGCDAGCSYCILPRVRGRPRSRALSDAAAEARRLVEAGLPEIVLTGIHLGRYGRDLDAGVSLADLVAAVAETPGLARLRLSSIEALEVDGALLDAMRHPAVCPHLHLPLQSGDADVLRRMNRPYAPAQFLEVVARARERLDRPAVTTDVMVGFPGEGDAAFENTAEVVRRARFSRLHVFPFSPRPGTAAAGMDGRPAPQAVRERGVRLRELGGDLAAGWAGGFVGEEARVLFERCRDGRLSGYTDRYVTLTAPGPADLAGRVASVLCIRARGAALIGHLAADSIHHDVTTSTTDG